MIGNKLNIFLQKNLRTVIHKLIHNETCIADFRNNFLLCHQS